MQGPDVYLAQQGRKRKPILGDGNCFFRAILFVMNGSEDKHGELRQSILAFVEHNHERFRPYVMQGSFEVHVIRMRHEGVWQHRSRPMVQQAFTKCLCTFFHLILLPNSISGQLLNHQIGPTFSIRTTVGYKCRATSHISSCVTRMEITLIVSLMIRTSFQLLLLNCVTILHSSTSHRESSRASAKSCKILCDYILYYNN